MAAGKAPGRLETPQRAPRIRRLAARVLGARAVWERQPEGLVSVDHLGQQRASSTSGVPQVRAHPLSGNPSVPSTMTARWASTMDAMTAVRWETQVWVRHLIGEGPATLRRQPGSRRGRAGRRPTRGARPTTSSSGRPDGPPRSAAIGSGRHGAAARCSSQASGPPRPSGRRHAVTPPDHPRQRPRLVARTTSRPLRVTAMKMERATKPPHTATKQRPRQTGRRVSQATSRCPGCSPGGGRASTSRGGLL
jgi:hypothetical protein